MNDDAIEKAARLLAQRRALDAHLRTLSQYPAGELGPIRISLEGKTFQCVSHGSIDPDIVTLMLHRGAEELQRRVDALRS